ncbi:MAG: ADP-ribosylglycohydrolase family protein [Desulfamplus sp.]|nr:ADP-ribosylglycohydrolase family protein [Desulfamplus sp.]
MTISAGLRGNPNPDSQANGAMMRISPLGIFGAGFELHQVAEWAMQDAALTHPNLICKQANVLFAMGIAHAIQSGCEHKELYRHIRQWAVDMPVESALLETIKMEVSITNKNTFYRIRILRPLEFKGLTVLSMTKQQQIGSGRRNGVMILQKILGITNQVELAKAEEKISKKKAKQLFDSGDIEKVDVGTFGGLAFIHAYLFDEIYDFAGKIREVNIAKSNFRFVPLMYLEQSLKYIDAMPQGNFDEIIEKYVEMNIAHPFREGNGRATRIWLDLILKKEIQQVIDWNLVDKEEYLSAMERSPVKDVEIKLLLKSALTDQIHDRALYMKGIDVSYFYEGYSEFRTEEL